MNINFCFMFDATVPPRLGPRDGQAAKLPDNHVPSYSSWYSWPTTRPHRSFKFGQEAISQAGRTVTIQVDLSQYKKPVLVKVMATLALKDPVLFNEMDPLGPVFFAGARVEVPRQVSFSHVPALYHCTGTNGNAVGCFSHVKEATVQIWEIDS